jgi:hypothetical protein
MARQYPTCQVAVSPAPTPLTSAAGYGDKDFGSSEAESETVIVNIAEFSHRGTSLSYWVLH